MSNLNLWIIDREGIVHKTPDPCSTFAQARTQLNITPLQAFVYKLAMCRRCWYGKLAEFYEIVGVR